MNCCLKQRLISSLSLSTERASDPIRSVCSSSISSTGENARGVCVCVTMIQTRIILYFCMYGIQIEQEKQNTSEKKTKVKYFLQCFCVVLCCVVFQSIIQEQESRIDRKNLCAYHTHTLTRGRALIRVRASRRRRRGTRRRDSVVNNARVATNRRVLQNNTLFLCCSQTHKQAKWRKREREEGRRPSLSVVYRL